MYKYISLVVLYSITLLGQTPVVIRQGGNDATVTGANALKVDNSGVTQPVSGTVTATGPLTDTQLRATPVPVSGTVTATQATGSNLHIVCDSGCTPGGSFSDDSAFTAGTTAINNVGGVYNDGLSAVTSGNASAARITSARGIHINIRNASGTEIGTASNPIRIDPTGSTTQPVSGTFWQATQPISAASLPLPTGASTETTLSTLNGKIPASPSTDRATAAAPFSTRLSDGSAFYDALTDTQLRATPVAVSGTVSTGGLTDTQLRATPVPISGTVTATGPLTDTQLRATAVPVSGTVTATGPLTDAQLRATAVPVSGPLTDTQIRATALPVSGTVSITANSAVNVAQINGVTPLMGAGNTGTGSQRVTIASDQASIPVAATLTSETTKVIGTVRHVGNVGGVMDAVVGAAVPANAMQVGGTDGTNLIVPYIDPCQRGAKSFGNISQTANTQIITGVSAKRIYFCSFNVVGADAENLSVVAGTGTVCATSTVAVPGLSGGATAAAGWNFSANGGIQIGNGSSSIAQTTVNADNVCLFMSGSGRTSGGFSYVAY